MLIRIFNILLIEDNPADIRLVEETFKESEINTELSVVNDGIEAMNFLKHEKIMKSHLYRSNFIGFKFTAQRW